MTEQLISLEVAKLAKEKGFINPAGEQGYYRLPDVGEVLLWIFKDIEHEFLGYAPSQSILQRWLREEHYFNISVLRTSIGSDEWVFSYELDYLPKKHWGGKEKVCVFCY